jgi:integrase
MPRVASKPLTTNRDGSFSKRKRIPEDVQDAYAKLYGKRCEERFNSGPAVSDVVARAKHREWLSEIEARIASIRAERMGEGRTLTPQQARGLAGKWYDWFTDRGLAKPRSVDYWAEETSEPYDALRVAVWGSEPLAWPEGRDPFDDWDRKPKARANVRPLVADVAGTAQFLHSHGLTLDPSSRDMFLDFVCKDFFAALELLQRRAKGDYGPDEQRKQFPEFERPGDPGLTPWMLFEQWVAEAKPAPATVDRWRSVFLKLQGDFKDRSAASITPQEANEWAQGLPNPQRGPRTVRDVWVNAAKAVFNLAVDKQQLTVNPFAKIKIKVPKARRLRDGKAFTEAEARMILKAAFAIANPKTKGAAARRWVPWLCAYSGARGGEITQIRGIDVVTVGGVNAINITPEAGTVKTREARTVPLHSHLIDQGFLAFVKRSGQGPLFYTHAKANEAPTDATNPPKERYVKAREHLADWVRRLGVTDPEVKPNHAWRDTFKLIGHRHGISERLLDEITGHAPVNVGRGYGVPTLQDKAEALQRFPRYSLVELNRERCAEDVPARLPPEAA